MQKFLTLKWNPYSFVEQITLLLGTLAFLAIVFGGSEKTAFIFFFTSITDTHYIEVRFLLSRHCRTKEAVSSAWYLYVKAIGTSTGTAQGVERRKEPIIVIFCVFFVFFLCFLTASEAHFFFFQALRDPEKRFSIRLVGKKMGGRKWVRRELVGTDLVSTEMVFTYKLVLHKNFRANFLRPKKQWPKTQASREIE